MFLHFCGLLAVATLVLTLPAVWDGSLVRVGVAWVWYGASGLFLAWTSYLLARFLLWVRLRLFSRPLLAEFTCWGIDWEGGGWSGFVSSAAATAWCAFVSFLTIRTVVCSQGDFSAQTAYSGLALLWLTAIGIPVLVVLADFSSLEAKAAELRRLPKVFRRWFPHSEILSMYECLHAPGVPRSFWEEYITLPVMQVSDANNRRFRTRVEPYVLRDNAGMQRTILFVAALAVLVAILVALPTVLDILTGCAGCSRRRRRTSFWLWRFLTCRCPWQ